MISSHGQCHCGNISLDLHFPEHTHSMTACLCRCQYCRMHGAIWLGRPICSMQVSAELVSQTQFYEDRALGIHYLICRHCGVLTSVLSRIENQYYGNINANIVNLPAHVDTDVFQFGPHPNISARLQLRKESWVPDVRLSTELMGQLEKTAPVAQPVGASI